MASDLKAILTPSLFNFVVDCRIPFPKDEPLKLNEVGLGGGYNDDGLEDKFRERVFPVLQTLSKVGLENMPDMMEFLPAPTSPDFPIQSLGLQLLIDQGPRALFDGLDERWTNSYFDHISNKLARSLLALPSEQRPASWTRWKEFSTADFWIIARTFFGAPHVHRGTVESQEIALAFAEETRSTIEQITGQTDPNRDVRDEVLSDVYGFPRMAMEGPPRGDDVTTASYCWWVLKLMDIHKPIIDRYGRYPYQNAIRGLDSTVEEKEWIEKTNHFAEAAPDVEEQVRADILANRWTPLGST